MTFCNLSTVKLLLLRVTIRLVLKFFDLTMERNIKVCRICLITDVKMFYIDDVLEYYISLLANDESYTMFPNYICFECASLLMKFIKFRKKFVAAQSILSNIVKECGEINEDKIKGIHNSITELKSNLVYKKLSSTSLNNKMIEVEISPENPEVCIKPDIEETKFINEFSEFAEEKEEIDTKPEVEHNRLDNEEGLADNAIINLVKVEASTGEDEYDDDLTYVLIVNKQPEVKTDNQKIKSEGVQKVKSRETRKRRAAPTKTTHSEPKRTKSTNKADDDSIDLSKYFTIINLSKEEQLEEFNKRKQSSNYLNTPFQCNMCYKGFIHTQAWKLHMLKHVPTPGDVECLICKIRVKTRRLLNEHKKGHEVKFICKSCPRVCMYKDMALRHQKWHAGVTYKCPHCDVVCSKWTSYLGHVRKKHPSQFICNECGCSFVSQKGLSMHKTMTHHAVEKGRDDDDEAKTGPYCKECDIKFVSVEAWNRHMVISDKHKQTAHFENLCRVCGKTFKSLEELRVHHKKEHAPKYKQKTHRTPTDQNSLTWPSKCEHCSEEFYNVRQKWLHYQKIHPNEKYPHKMNYDYTCDICGKIFPSNAKLIYHTRTHSEERMFKCNMCGKAFHNPANLRKHETTTHSDLRPFPCSHCSKAFKCKGALDRHFRCHSGAKPYTCELCGQAFSQWTSRKQHVNSVHLKQPAPPRAPRRRRPTHADVTQGSSD